MRWSLLISEYFFYGRTNSNERKYRRQCAFSTLQDSRWALSSSFFYDRFPSKLESNQWTKQGSIMQRVVVVTESIRITAEAIYLKWSKDRSLQALLLRTKTDFFSFFFYIDELLHFWRTVISLHYTLRKSPISPSSRTVLTQNNVIGNELLSQHSSSAKGKHGPGSLITH